MKKDFNQTAKGVVDRALANLDDEDNTALTIEPGDIVSYWEDGKMKFSWLTVLEINGEEAICSINVLPENMDERPTSLETKAIGCDLKDLRLVKKN